MQASLLASPHLGSLLSYFTTIIVQTHQGVHDLKFFLDHMPLEPQMSKMAPAVALGLPGRVVLRAWDPGESCFLASAS
jgi:hypothetical protein